MNGYAITSLILSIVFWIWVLILAVVAFKGLDGGGKKYALATLFVGTAVTILIVIMDGYLLNSKSKSDVDEEVKKAEKAAAVAAVAALNAANGGTA